MNVLGATHKSNCENATSSWTKGQRTLSTRSLQKGMEWRVKSGEWKALENTWSNVRDEECKIIKDPFTLAAPFSLLFELF